MKQKHPQAVFLIVAPLVLALLAAIFLEKAGTLHTYSNTMQTALTITSPEFANGATIPAKYTCVGKNASPPLIVAGVPAEAKSLAFIMDDPDAPGGTWTHWVRFNMAPVDFSLGEDTDFPQAAKGAGSAGSLDYQGPCPPSGTHHYHFKFYALDAALDLPQGADANELYSAMKGHILAQGELVGLFSK